MVSDKEKMRTKKKSLGLVEKQAQDPSRQEFQERDSGGH